MANQGAVLGLPNVGLYSGIDNLTGSGFDDQLVGKADSNVINGGGGAKDLVVSSGDYDFELGFGYLYREFVGSNTGEDFDSLVNVERVHISGSDSGQLINAAPSQGLRKSNGRKSWASRTGS